MVMWWKKWNKKIFRHRSWVHL